MAAYAGRRRVGGLVACFWLCQSRNKRPQQLIRRSTMIYSSNIFVVIDPTTDNKPVLDRVGRLTETACSHVHFFLSDYPDKNEINSSFSMKDAKYRFQKEKLAWVKELTKPIETDTLKPTYELYWNKDWHEAIPHAAVRRASNLIIKSTFSHSTSTRKLSKTSDFLLIRRCVSPILFVREDRSWRSNTILAAVNLEASDEEHTRLNIAVIQRAKTLAQITGMEVALVSAVSDSVVFKDYIDDKDTEYSSNEEIIGAYFGLPADKILLSKGKAKDTILDAAAKTDADIVVIGTVGRSGVKGMLIGNTAEKILDELVSDVLVVT